VKARSLRRVSLLSDNSSSYRDITDEVSKIEYGEAQSVQLPKGQGKLLQGPLFSLEGRILSLTCTDRVAEPVV
jgi:hypothetical protein